MAITLDQVDAFHTDRGNAEWAEIPDRAAALLKAFDYVEEAYAPLVDGAGETPRYLLAVATLALRINQKPQDGVAAPVVKSENKEGAGFKREVEYFEPVSADPFPGVTKLFEPLRVSTVTPSVSFGKLVRR